MAKFQVFGQSSISPSSRPGAASSKFSRPAMSGAMEAMASAEDPTLRLAPLVLPSDDKSHASSHGSGSRRELPSLC